MKASDWDNTPENERYVEFADGTYLKEENRLRRVYLFDTVPRFRCNMDVRQYLRFFPDARRDGEDFILR